MKNPVFLPVIPHFSSTASLPAADGSCYRVFAPGCAGGIAASVDAPFDIGLFPQDVCLEEREDVQPDTVVKGKVPADGLLRQGF